MIQPERLDYLQDQALLLAARKILVEQFACNLQVQCYDSLPASAYIGLG
jgi:hypothetical protein